MCLYIIDEFVQEFFSEGSVTLSSVLSCRTIPSKRAASRQRVLIDFHNSWLFDSDSQHLPLDASQQVLSRLQLCFVPRVNVSAGLQESRP